MITWKRLIVACCALLVVSVVFTMLALPDILRSKAEQWVADNTGRVLSIGDISINPFTLTVEIGPLSLSETDQSGRFAAWENLRVVLSPRSLYHLAPVLREIRLVEPYLHIERLEEGKFNFSDLVPAPSQTEMAKTEAKPARFSLNNILIEKGRIELVDRSVADSIEHRVRDLNLSIPFIGNLPYLVEEPVHPRFSAVINDSPIDLKGDLTPFAENREFSLRLDLADIDLPYYLAYLPIELPIELRSGRLGFDLQLRYRAGMAQKPELQMSGIVNLTALDIWDRHDARLFFLPLLRVDIAPSQPLAQDIHLTSVDIYNLEVNVSRDHDGIWNHSRLKMPGQETAGQEAGEQDPTDPGLRLAVDQIRLRDGRLLFRDDQPAGGFETTAREITIDLSGFTLAPDAEVPITASLTTDNGEQIFVDGTLGLTPLAVDIEVRAQGLPLAVYQPYYQQQVAIRPGGTLDLAARIAVHQGNPFGISQGRADLYDLDLPLPDNEGFKLERLAVEGLTYTLSDNTLGLAALRLEGGDIRISRDPAGRLSFVSPDYPVLANQPGHGPADSAGATPDEDYGAEFHFSIGTISVNDWSADFKDRRPGQTARFTLTGIEATLDNLSAPESVSSTFDLKATLNRRGQIHFSGNANLATQQLNLNTRLSRLPLKTLAPYLVEQTNLVLAEGSLDARLKTQVSATPSGLKATFGGDIGIDKIYGLDAGRNREDLIKWDSLQIAGIDGSWAPLELSVASVTMSDYFAKVLIDENAQLNFMKVFKKGDGETGSSSLAEGPTDTDAATPEPGVERPADIRIKQVTLQGGQVAFTDLSLPRPFHADMRELGGSILGLSSDSEARAGVDLRGKLRNQSPLVIEGEVNPLAEDLYLDLKLSFSDIEMSPMSPYSGTYLGYLIEKGKLNLDLEYHVEDGKLKASNNVFLDQFTFGEPFESDKSVGLPVKLAVALLKDRNGEIHLDIPVSGELDDPQFSIAGVIWKIIRNLLVKAATSPLALLGALAGGGDEDFSSVEFAFGTAELAEPEREKLAQLGEALIKRPSLILEVQGFADPENDPEGYRREQLREKIERARRLDLAQKQDAHEEPAPMSREEYSEYLWAVYKEEDFPKPRNFIGMTKHLADEELEKLIYTNTRVGPEALEQLARQRAQTARNYLVEQAGVAAERIFLTAPEITMAPAKDEEIHSRVEFDIGVK